jgi:hypothetical protein
VVWALARAANDLSGCPPLHLNTCDRLFKTCQRALFLHQDGQPKASNSGLAALRSNRSRAIPAPSRHIVMMMMRGDPRDPRPVVVRGIGPAFPY